MSDRGTIHTSLPLSNVAVGYKQAPTIWQEVMKPVSVEQDTGKYKIFGQEFLRYYGKIRAEKTESQRVDSYSASEGTYACEMHSYHDIVDDRERKKADPIVEPERRVTENLTKIVNLDIEVDVAADVFNGSNYTSMTKAAANPWDATNADGDPIGDVDYAKTQVAQNIGVDPNVMVIGREVFDQIKRHPDLLEMFKYTGKGILTAELLAQAFGVEKVLVGNSYYITSKPGQSTITKALLWGKSCALLYVPQSAAIDEPAWGYVLLETLFGGLTAMVDRIPKPDLGKGAVKIEVTRSYDIVKTAQKAGYLLTSVVS